MSKKITLTQKVKLFKDKNVLGTQSCSIDATDSTEPWINIIHDGGEQSMSLENWHKLLSLVDSAKKELDNNIYHQLIGRINR